jgi:hypothetical protein
VTVFISLLSSALLGAAAPGALPLDRLDHRGAVGLTLAVGLEKQDASISHPTGDQRPDDLGVALRVMPALSVGDNGNELQLDLRLFKGTNLGYGLGVGYRGYAGRDELKTFFELGVRADSRPAWAVSGVAGIGLMYELSQLIGLFASGEVAVGYGSALRFSAALFGGVQLRSYLLEP